VTYSHYPLFPRSTVFSLGSCTPRHRPLLRFIFSVSIVAYPILRFNTLSLVDIDVTLVPSSLFPSVNCFYRLAGTFRQRINESPALFPRSASPPQSIFMNFRFLFFLIPTSRNELPPFSFSRKFALHMALHHRSLRTVLSVVDPSSLAPIPLSFYSFVEEFTSLFSRVSHPPLDRPPFAFVPPFLFVSSPPPCFFDISSTADQLFLTFSLPYFLLAAQSCKSNPG